jgi:hypothetical protein
VLPCVYVEHNPRIERVGVWRRLAIVRESPVMSPSGGTAKERRTRQENIRRSPDVAKSSPYFTPPSR